MAAAVCAFASMEGAATTVIQTIQLGIPVARIEIIDETQLAIVNRFSKTSFPEAPTLFFEFHGTSQASVDEQARPVRGDRPRARRPGFRVDDDARGRGRCCGRRGTTSLRDARLAARRAGVDHRRLRADFAPGRVHSRDAGGPARATDLVAPLVGHAGDGNFHLIFMLDPDDPDEFARVSA